MSFLKLLSSLKTTYPNINFEFQEEFAWSPTKKLVYIAKDAPNTQKSCWSLLHELGHGLLAHQSYETDFELLKLEVLAWQKAVEVGLTQGFEIDEDHIENCLDTYRDWLHKRSACISCNARAFQQDKKHYRCYNCHSIWKVSPSRFCRIHRTKVA